MITRGGGGALDGQRERARLVVRPGHVVQAQVYPGLLPGGQRLAFFERQFDVVWPGGDHAVCAQQAGALLVTTAPAQAEVRSPVLMGVGAALAEAGR